MKKVICLLLSALFIISLAACGEAGNNTSDPNASGHADRNTIELVNTAYKTTSSGLSGVTALAYNEIVKRTVSLENKTEAMSKSEGITFVKSDNVNKFAYSASLRTAEDTVNVREYSDGEKFYGSVVDTTYSISANDKTKSTAADLLGIPKIWDASLETVTDTTIVDTSEEGYGFVLEYDLASLKLDLSAIYGELFIEKTSGKEITPKSFVISGIINKDGMLTAETLTYTYTYNYEVERTDVDPDNLASGETVPTDTKIATVTLSSEITLGYGITEVAVPGEIVIPDADSGTKLKEISTEDFNKLYSLSIVKEKKEEPSSSTTSSKKSTSSKTTSSSKTSSKSTSSKKK